MSALTARLPGRRTGTDVAAELRPPSAGRDRQALMAIGSLVIVCASVATFAGIYSSAGHKTAAVVVEHALVQGQPITADQLGQADVSLSAGVAYVPVTEASTVLGKRAASAVPAGSLLTAGDLTSAPAVVAGSAVVGLALKDGQFPTSGLTPGEQVMIVQTATPGSPLSAPISGTRTSAVAPGTTVLSGAGTGVLVADATVFSVAAPAANASGGFALLVSVDVPAPIAPDVATASAAGQVSLVLVAQGSAVAGTATPGAAP